VASEEKIQLRLDMSVPFERDFAQAYRQNSRGRRQEWMRLILRLGFQALKAGEQAGEADMSRLLAAAAGRTAVPAAGTAPLSAVAQPVLPTPTAPTSQAASAPEPLLVFAPVADAELEGESASALKGFFPEIGD
jgi:hypothetical protein